MPTFTLRTMAIVIAVINPFFIPGVFAADLLQPSKDATDSPTHSAPPAVQKIETIEVTLKRLDQARNGLAPETGSTVYRFDSKDIDALPLGDSTPLNQILLRAPGVVQDSYGQVHIRGDHANLQYRINGVVIPEPISGFGQMLDTGFVQQINVLTGTLPAQYGYRTGGIIDIQSKGTVFENGGRINFLTGSHRHREARIEWSGSQNTFSYFLTGSYLRNDLGIENPLASRKAIHDRTTQVKGFGYLSWVYNNDSRSNFIFGYSNNKFQIPNVPDQFPSFVLGGAPTADSTALDARQQEKNHFQILSYQGSARRGIDYQISLFQRYTDLHYRPDSVGDLAFYGIAADILRRNETQGIQADISYAMGHAHTLRAGLFYSYERAAAFNNAFVFPADEEGNQLSTTPLAITDNSKIKGRLSGIYVQDEWKPAEKLTVNYGVRYDQTSTVVNENQWSPRLGIVYELFPQTRVHAGYARYFTPPPSEKIDTTSVNLFLNTTNALPSDANTAVQSERSNYYAIGIAHQLTPQITLGLDGYYRDVRHLQDEGQFGNALIFSAFNYARGKIYGLELSGTYKHHNLTAYINAAYSSARATRIETGQFNFDEDELAFINQHWVHLDHAQRWSGSAGISYRQGDTLWSGDVLHGSGLRRGFANTEHLPAYTQFNLSVVKVLELPGFGKFDTRFALINVFDKTYLMRDGSGIGVGAPQFGLRRSFYVGIDKSF